MMPVGSYHNLKAYYLGFLGAISLFCSACQAVQAPPIPTVSPTPLIITSETQDSKLPDILIPGVELKVVAGSGEGGYQNGPALEAKFGRFLSLAVTPADELIIADPENHCLRRLDKHNQVTSIVCNGEKEPSPNAWINPAINNPKHLQLYQDKSLLMWDSGVLYQADLDKRSLTPLMASDMQKLSLEQQKTVIPLEGGVTAMLLEGRSLFFVVNSIIQKVNLDTKKIEHVAGRSLEHVNSYNFNPYDYYKDGRTDLAMFAGPRGMALLNSHNLLVADSSNMRIRMVDLSHPVPHVKTLTGKEWEIGAGQFIGGFRDGDLSTALLNLPSDLVVGIKNSVWLNDLNNDSLRVIVNEKVITLIKNIHISNIAINYSESKLYISDYENYYIYELSLKNIKLDEIMPQITYYNGIS